MSTAPQPGTPDEIERQRTRQLALLVESVSEYAIFSLDIGGHILSWTPAAQKIKGYTADEAIGQHFSMFYTDEDRARDHPAWELEEATRSGRYEEEGWRVRKDGSRFWANVVITALRDPPRTGELIGFGKVTRDLSDRQRVLEQQRLAADQLAQANVELRTFASAAAHDLTEPLRTVRGFADLLATRHAEQLDDRGKEFLEYVRAGAERMQALIEHLLVYARAGVQERALVPVDADVAVRRVLAGLEAAISERNATVEVELDGVQRVRADSSGLELVFQNLVTNALKFSPDGAPRVRISAAPDPMGWRFAIADEGIGIPEELRATVFAPFRRVHGRDDIKGTGLGLAICQRIVEGFGGTIGVESVPGEGSTFHFTLRAAEEPAA